LELIKTLAYLCYFQKTLAFQGNDLHAGVYIEHTLIKMQLFKETIFLYTRGRAKNYVKKLIKING
jgi:hypothetical protein